MPQISLSQIFAWRITSKYNKDVVFLLTGERGSGKSYSALYLAWKTAEEIAKIKGGKWQDYFCLENIAIIDPTELVTKMQNLKPYNIYLLDDAGAGWSARSFMSKQNQLLNHILEVCRTQNAGIFISTPDLFLIDKVPRNLSSFVGEVAESHHDKGYNLLKVFRTNRLRREGKTLYEHLTFHTPQGKSKILRWVTHMPPKELVDQYNVIRDRRAVEMMQQVIQPAEVDQNPSGKVSQRWSQLVEQYGDTVADLRSQGKNASEISHSTGLSEYSVRRLCSLLDMPFVRHSS